MPEKLVQKLRPREVNVGRLIASVTVENPMEKGKVLRCEALVDTGASHLVLPLAWKDQLGSFESVQNVDLETADQTFIEGQICGPVKIQIEAFRPVYSEVLFVKMEPEDGAYQPLLGYIPLEQSSLAVDLLGHRLVHVKYMDLK